MKKFLFLLIGIFLLSFNIVLVNAEEDDNIGYIDHCQAIMPPKTYFILTEDLIFTPGDYYDTCLKITVLGPTTITLDCLGHEISSTKKNIGIGIHLFSSNIYIKNCKIKNFYSGVYTSDTSDCKIWNNTIYDNQYGIHISDSDYEAHNHEIVNNTFSKNENSIFLSHSYGNKIYNNYFESIEGYRYCIHSTESGDNIIYNNLFKVSPVNLYKHTYDEHLMYPPQNYWSLPEIEEGKRICGPGKFIGGNYYDDYESNGETVKGHSNTCEDIKSGPNQDQPGSDCICDVLYLLSTNDKYPLANNCWDKCPDGCHTDQDGTEYKISTGDPNGPYNCDILPSGFEVCRYLNREECMSIGDDPDGSDITIAGNCAVYKGICTSNLETGEAQCGKGNKIGGGDDQCTEGYDPRADINKDNRVDILDITKIAVSFGSQRGDPKYDSNADLNSDDIINIIDVSIVAKDFGKTEMGNLLLDYTITQSGNQLTCKGNYKKCSDEFREKSLVDGKEWSCSYGKCVGCSNNEACYKLIENIGIGYKFVRSAGTQPLGLDEECIVTHCSEDKCEGIGYVRKWFCATDGYCRFEDYTNEECGVNTEKNKVCAKIGEKVEEVDASKDYTCRPDNSYLRDCKQNDCYGYQYYPECDGNGNCDMSTDINSLQYFELEQKFAEPPGKVLNTNCGSIDGTCGSSDGCYLDPGKTVSCSKGKKLLACNGETGGGKCEYDLQTWEDKISCNPYTCSNGECTDTCDETCGAKCVPPKSQNCGNCNLGTQTCGSDCQWGTCQENGCKPGTKQACGNCNLGTQTCGSDCQWGTCQENGCKPESQQACRVGECCSGTQTCGSDCQWSVCPDDNSLCDQRAECVGCYCVG
jgi:parallel beta-helix repeat protein